MFVSEAFALSSAVCIALSSMFINELNGRVPLLRLARWQITAGFVITACAALVLGGWRSLESWQVWYLAASGVFGIAIASTTYFAAIYSDAQPNDAIVPMGPPPSLLGISLGILTAFGQALGSLLARPAMASGVEPFTAMAIRSGLARHFSARRSACHS